MDRFAFYKELYSIEIDRHNKLDNSVTFPVGILIALGGVINFYSNYITFNDSVSFQFCFDFLLFVSMLFWALTAFYLFQTKYPRKYMYLPTPTVLEEYRIKLNEWNNSQLSTFKRNPEEIESMFTEYVIKTLSECTEQNTKNNEKKTAYLHNSIHYLMWTMIFLSFVLMIHLFT